MFKKQIFNLALFLGLFSFNLIASSPKKTVHLSTASVVDGVPVKAGDIEVFVPNGELATGVLSQDHTLQTLPLPKDTEVRMKEPHRLDTMVLPQVPVNKILEVPFRSRAVLTLRYDKSWNRLTGLVVESPHKLSGFPVGQINPIILENDVAAECSQYSEANSSLRWSCEYSVTLARDEEQSFGTQKVQLPAKSSLHFNHWGMNSLHLHEDSILLGLPVSHKKPIRINRWVLGGSMSLVGLTLSQDAEYDQLPLSATGEVEFFEADSAGHSRVSNFTPSRDIALRAANQWVTLAPLTRAHLNRDRSIKYGVIASDQVIQGILIPQGSLIFFGASETSGISSVGLFKGARIIVDGVTYINDMGGGTLFLDFTEGGKVFRVRKVNP